MGLFLERKMETFMGSVEIMLFVYALAAVVSYMMAGVIKLIFAGIQLKNAKSATDSATPEGKT